MLSNNSSEATVSTAPLYWIIATTVCPTSIILYCLVLYVIAKFPADFKNSYFTIIVGLGIGDITALLYVMHSFVCCLMGTNYLGVTVDRVFAFLYNTVGWYSVQNLCLLTSINRFVAITMFSKYGRIFTVRLTKILVALCFVLALLPGLPYQIVGTNIFIIDAIVPGFVEENNSTKNVLFMDLIYGSSVGLLVISAHVISGILCIARRRNIVIAKLIAYSREIKLLMQGTFFGAMLLINTITVFCPIGELSWVIGVILVSGFNPFVYIITDGKLRRKIWALITKQKITNVSTIQIRSVKLTHL